MNQRISFTLFDHAGNPLSGETPSIINYRKADGSPVLPMPGILDKGVGFYEFSVDFELSGPVAYVVDCGENSAVQYMVGSLGELIAFMMYDEDGNPDPTRTPEFISYTDGETALAQPTIVSLAGGLFGFVPVPVPEKLVQYVVGDADNKYSGTIGCTSLGNTSPVEDTEIDNTQVITFDVLDTETFLGRVLIGIQYPEMDGATELVWDGTAAVGPHTVTVVPITDGYRYSVLRTGGWPSAPTVRVFVTNLGGREI